MATLVYFVILLALTGHSSVIYCVCKDGVGDSTFQKALDYACGAGTDCSPILQNDACYQPNIIKDHCSYAVNSYFQRKGQIAQSCDFYGAASQSQTTPSTASSTCVYPASTRICRLVEPLTLHKLQETWRILPTEATAATTKQQERIGGKSHKSNSSQLCVMADCEFQESEVIFSMDNFDFETCLDFRAHHENDKSNLSRRRKWEMLTTTSAPTHHPRQKPTWVLTVVTQERGRPLHPPRRRLLGKILEANPNYVLSKPSSQGVVRKILILSPESELKWGSIYFLIPSSSVPEKKKKSKSSGNKKPSKKSSKSWQSLGSTRKFHKISCSS